MHALLQDMQFSSRHGAFQAQQQTIMVLHRVVNPIQVCNQGMKEGAQLQKLMPVLVRACQPRHLHPQDDADMIQAHLPDQALEARSPLGATPGFAQILINDQDTGSLPSQCLGAIDQAILQPRGLLMVQDLLDGGLAHIDDCKPLAMEGTDFLGA
jgi:hypothetical protein